MFYDKKQQEETPVDFKEPANADNPNAEVDPIGTTSTPQPPEPKKDNPNKPTNGMHSGADQPRNVSDQGRQDPDHPSYLTGPGAYRELRGPKTWQQEADEAPYELPADDPALPEPASPGRQDPFNAAPATPPLIWPKRNKKTKNASSARRQPIPAPRPDNEEGKWRCSCGACNRIGARYCSACGMRAPRSFPFGGNPAGRDR